VRRAVPDDAADIARIQVITWRTAYRTLLPAEVLDDWDDDAATAAWRNAIIRPPTPGHRVLVAEESGTTVGFLAFGPAELGAGEQASTAGPTAEVAALLVEPRWGRRGHGSRLLAALADLARADGLGDLVCWLPDADRVTAEFLSSAGWAPDGRARGLDTGTTTIRQDRWHTTLDDDPPETSDGRGAQ
jgi:GNAT superfamily N-acetyltransferase